MKLSLKDIFVLIVLLAPTCTLLATAGYKHYHIQQETSFVLPIRGYDPRDLVHGHYLQFQIDWPWRSADPISCTREPSQCRLCLQSNAALPQSVNAALVAMQDVTKQNPACVATIADIESYDRMMPNTRNTLTLPAIVRLKHDPFRFYVDENEGPWLDAYFRKYPDAFTAEVKIHNETIQVQKLFINGRPYQDVMREKPEILD